MARRARPRSRGRAEVIEGYPPDAVVRWAVKNSVDLIVAGSHRGLVQRMFLGGFATYLAAHAPCSVLLVRPDGTATSPTQGVPFRHLAVCVDDSAPSLDALAEARLLRDLGADRLSVIHIAQWPLPYLVGGFAMVIDPTDVFERQQQWLVETVDETRGEEAVFLRGSARDRRLRVGGAGATRPHHRRVPPRAWGTGSCSAASPAMSPTTPRATSCSPAWHPTTSRRQPPSAEPRPSERSPQWPTR